MKKTIFLSAMLFLTASAAQAECKNGMCFRDDVAGSKALGQARKGFTAREGVLMENSGPGSRQAPAAAPVNGEEAPGVKSFADAPPAPKAEAKSDCKDGSCPLKAAGSKCSGGQCPFNKSGSAASNAANAAKAVGKACKNCGTSGGIAGIFTKLVRAVGSIFGLA